MKKKKVYLFTNTYPYGKMEESFLDNEIIIASQLGIDITIIPLKKKNEKREIPSNISVSENLANIPFKTKLLIAFQTFFSFQLWKLIIKRQKKYSKKYYLDTIKYLFGSFLICYFITKYKNHLEPDSIWYSYWFNHTPLGLVWAKQKEHQFKNCRIYSRAHGFDVYEENVDVYIPWREQTLSEIDRLYVVSQTGVNFLQKRYPKQKDKIRVSKLGVIPLVKEKQESQQYDLSIVSCSSIIPIKRIPLIYDSINNFCRKNKNMTIKWTHIGDGIERNSVEEKIKQDKVENLHIEMKGLVANSYINKLYKTTKFNVFVNLSTTEGIPVSMMEAINANIPLIATNVGGNSEIVTIETGILLPADFEQYEFEEAIQSISKKEAFYFDSIASFYNQNYNATKNYSDFYKTITS